MRVKDYIKMSKSLAIINLIMSIFVGFGMSAIIYYFIDGFWADTFVGMVLCFLFGRLVGGPFLTWIERRFFI